MKIYLIEIVNRYTKCFVLNLLDIVYCLYWCRAYQTLLSKSREKLGIVVFTWPDKYIKKYRYKQIHWNSTKFFITKFFTFIDTFNPNAVFPKNEITHRLIELKDIP